MNKTAEELLSIASHKNPCSNIIVTPFISFALILSSFILQDHIGLSLWDEGFLWYGSTQTSLGYIPIRDFQSYDPGRYYWVAAWFKILGNSLLSLRISLAAFQFLGLTCGLFAVSRILKSRFWLVLTGVVLLLWMYPRHKIFEHSLAMGAVYVGMLLMESPTVRRHFFSGLFIGVAAFFGRNHGLYYSLGFSLIVAYTYFAGQKTFFIKKISLFFLGIVIGYLPILLMIVSVVGFNKAFYESILFLFELGRTNIPLPVPWPWLINFGQQNLLEFIRQFLVGSIFLIGPFFYAASLVRVFTLGSKGRGKESALFISSCFIGIMYMHYAFSRADINHLAQGIHPLLLGMISFPVGKINIWHILRKSFVFCLLVVSILSIGLSSPYYKYISNRDGYTSVDIDGDSYTLKRDTARIISAVKSINDDLVKPGEQFLIAPHWPTLYSILQRKAPLWEIYFLHPRPLAMQREMINQLQAQDTNWIFLGDVALNGHDELRFKNTHRLLWEYFQRDYSIYPRTGLPANYVLLRKKQTE